MRAHWGFEWSKERQRDSEITGERNNANEMERRIEWALELGMNRKYAMQTYELNARMRN